jgi:hypothetical protein
MPRAATPQPTKQPTTSHPAIQQTRKRTMAGMTAGMMARAKHVKHAPSGMRDWERGSLD